VLYLSKEKNINTKDKYILETNEKQEVIMKKINKESNQEINIFFENEDETNVMENVLKQLSKYYIEEILKIET
jgi:hypothetical protein